MILVDRSIIEYMTSTKLRIYPYSSTQLGPSSYDFRLGREFMVFKPQTEIIDPFRVSDLMEKVVIDYESFFVLHPGQFALGCSVERFVLADNLIAQVNGKSSLGRLGLQVHATAGFFDPGWDGVATLEFSNVSPIPIRLYPNMLIAQMVFFQGSAAAINPYGKRVTSKYQNADSVQPSLYEKG